MPQDSAPSPSRPARAPAPTPATLDRLPVACVLLDRDLNFVHVNPAAEGLFGFSNAELDGRSPRDLFGMAAQWGDSERRFRYLAEGGEVAIGRAAVRARNGRRLVCEWHNSAVRTEDGVFVGVLGIAIDVTAAAREHDLLIASEDRYRLLFESNPLPTWVFDRETLKFLAVNDAAVAHYGYTREEFLAMSLRDIRPADDVEALEEEIRRLGFSGAGRSRWRHVKKSGDIIFVEVADHPIEFAGHHASLVVINDLTGQIALEEQLRQSQKMEAIGQLTGGIAHDLNNVLTSVIAHADLAAAAVPAGAPELRNDLQQAREAANRGAVLIRKLLAFGRRERLQLRPMSLPAFLAEVAGTMRHVIPETIELVTGLGDVPAIAGDPTAIEQMLINLLTNARDAMPEGGTIRLTVDQVELDDAHVQAHGWGRPGRFARLTVADTGTGMPPDVRERAFEPFFSTKPPEAGTGLGMSMVYGLVKQHLGFVHVDSELGRGTAVRLFFPLADGRASRLGAPLAASGTETVMIVEDEEPIRRAARRVLERHGYRVLVSGDGAEALERIRGGERVDLVISDAIMPRMGGLALHDALARERPEVAFLLTSGYTGAEVAEQHGGETGLPFLPKPWTMADLLARVRSVLDRGELPAR